MGKKGLAPRLQDWVEARRRFHLSHAHVQMARELGMNPRKLGKLDNRDQAPWKAPLPQFIERLYFKSFSRERPEVVMSVEKWARARRAKKAARKEARRRARVEGGDRPPGEPGRFMADLEERVNGGGPGDEPAFPERARARGPAPQGS